MTGFDLPRYSSAASIAEESCRDALLDLAALGFRPGALVDWRGARYRLTVLEVVINAAASDRTDSVGKTSAGVFRIACFGVKQRVDGSWGEHHHSLGSPALPPAAPQPGLVTLAAHDRKPA